MDNYQQKVVRVEKEENIRIRPKSGVLSILHHIVQSIKKLLELAVLFGRGMTLTPHPLLLPRSKIE
jgi:hypothetical protein